MEKDNGLDFSVNSKIVFSAGEAINREIRDMCSNLWNAKIINIYGMAEFDTVAAELNFERMLSLAPRLKYGLKINGEIKELKNGLTGTLVIKNDNTWYDTGDIFKIIGVGNTMWGKTWNVEFIKRDDESITLSDGTRIGEKQINSIYIEHPEITSIQIHVRHNTTMDEIRICVVSLTKLITKESIINTLLHSSIDIEDSYRHGIIKKIDVKFINECELIQTIRGKIPTIIKDGVHVGH